MREIPRTRLIAIAWLVFALVLAGVVAWECKMRSLGLVAGDLDDSKAQWAVERRKIAAGNFDDVVLVGSSRILFDTNLDVFQQVTGRRPIQLALAGTNPRPILTDFANDPSFKSLVIVDVTPDIYFGDWLGIPEFSGVIHYWRDQSPSERFGNEVGVVLSRRLAFLDGDYTLPKLIDQLDVPNRGDIVRPYLSVWKVWETNGDRQTFLWSGIEQNERLRQHARTVWGPFDGAPMDPKAIDRAIQESVEAVKKIRAHGGEVVFIRPPSAGLYYEHEQRSAPRRKTWDRLLRETGAFGIHFEDYPDMQGLDVPEWSHLSRESAKAFTRAYAGVLMKKVARLREPDPGKS
ncbi:MAG TPA: hypothetical protein VL219_06480 [Steroidobacteraceae bacterium]|nr:hypothetical protein [Steroidobacteraceae bacterium]